VPRDPERVALAYSEDSEWRNRAEFVKGRAAIREVGMCVRACVYVCLYVYV
jgi:nuclear transport factor 2 (NTF2) superfamily protein